MENLDKAVIHTINKHSMLKHGDEVLIALSGGADSVALFSFLYTYADELDITLRAAHLEHGLRGEESLRDRRFVEDLCEFKGVSLHVKSVDIAAFAKSRGLSVEVCARNERYAFFEQVCGNAKIATAHTASDNAETILLNLTRGTSLAGICGIPPVRGSIIRPLIECTRKMVENYCEENNLRYVTDSTNLSDEYSRNRVRHHIIPTLRCINPNLEGRFSDMAELLRNDNILLEQIAADALESMKLISPLSFDREAYLALEHPIMARVLIQILKSLDLRYDKYRIEQMDSFIRNGGAYQLSPEYRLVVRQSRFVFEKKTIPLPNFYVDITKNELENIVGLWRIAVYPGKEIILRLVDCKEFENTDALLLKNSLDYDKMNMFVNLRGRLPGDSIRLSGRGCTKSVRDLCRESGMDVSARQRMVIMEESGRTIWVEGFGVAEAAAPTKDSKRILTIEVVENNA